MTTFIERVEREYPEEAGECYDGDVNGCPYNYGYETEEESHKNCKIRGGKGCIYCWSREIPTDEPADETTEYL